MDVQELIGALGYRDNPNFLQGDALGRAADHAHIFRRACERINLQGVYALNQPPSETSQRDTSIPVVYVCEADSEKEASEYRRLAWNQNVAPFVIIRTPQCVRLFSGFNYAPPGGPRSASAVLDRPVEFRDIALQLGAFTSKAIDDGKVWKDYGRFVTPSGRVDWNLLQSLKKLDELLIGSGLHWRTSHALIGKYVFLWYLYQREILSPRRLSEWEIDKDEVFSRNATLAAFKTVLLRLEEWLNGSVFPLDWARKDAPGQHHLRNVAAVFSGDTLDRQLHLPFDAYDFSMIPVETLSAIYEQFLHAHEPKKERTRGKELGAYYTPVPLVNFMLEELDDKCPLKEGMTCFDASCGSGAFLVQCYRRLIENRVRKDGEAIRRPAELRDILVDHIFGIDRDADACRVTELSLILTLLDYVKPPDLSPVHNFRLPKLHNQNIFEADFFKKDSPWTRADHDGKYDWIVGNPPWVELKPGKPLVDGDATDDNADAREWIKENSQEMPVSGNQLAEAFLWKVTKHLRPNGVAAMLVPAMTLFKSESTAFRQEFFKTVDVWCVANFANLAEVLFRKRSREPAAALFYSRVSKKTTLNQNGRTILTYSPFVANQEANRPQEPRSRKDTWSIAVNGSEIREVSFEDAASGDNLVWKLAMWGSVLDAKLLHTVAQRFESLDVACDHLGIKMHEGSQLRKRSDSVRLSNPAPDNELVRHVRELVGKDELKPKRLGKCGRIFEFPQDALAKITVQRANLRTRGGEKGLQVSQPPHIIVGSTRGFAVYSDNFIFVPPRQVGIAGDAEHSDLLKALSLYLVSDFAIYHQFLTSPQMGIYKTIADLKTLKPLPFPVDNIRRQGLATWSDLHRQLVSAASTATRSSSLRRKRSRVEETPSLYSQEPSTDGVSRLEDQLNKLVNEALKLRESDTWLISDLVHRRRLLIQGKIDPLAIDPPSPDEMRTYCETLKRQLDSFFEVATDARHTVEVIHERKSAMIVVERGPTQSLQRSIRIFAASDEAAKALQKTRERLLQQHSQWLYFHRDLRVYRKNGPTYLFKPMQSIQWLRSQALIDAQEVLADSAGRGGT